MNINNVPVNPNNIIINNNIPINNQLVHIQEQLNDVYNLLQTIITNNYADNININNIHNILYNIQNMHLTSLCFRTQPPCLCSSSQ